MGLKNSITYLIIVKIKICKLGLLGTQRSNIMKKKPEQNYVLIWSKIFFWHYLVNSCFQDLFFSKQVRFCLFVVCFVPGNDAIIPVGKLNSAKASEI